MTFTVAGITEYKGEPNVRFTSDMVRYVKFYTKAKSARLDFIDLPTPMTKVEALKYMLTHKDFQSEEDQATISDTLAEKEKTSRAPRIRVSIENIKNRPRNNVSVTDILEMVNG
jgi:hypothetical protein